MVFNPTLTYNTVERNNMKNKCEDCEGLGYFTEVEASGITDPKDPYYYPHTERCDSCLVFSSDEEADNFLTEKKNDDTNR